MPAALLTLLAMRTKVGHKRILLFAFMAAIAALSSMAFYETLMHRGGTAVDLVSVVGQIADSDPRVEIWKFALDEISEHPWRGVGFGLRSFEYAFPTFMQEHPGLWHAHNIFINYGIQMGIPGVAAFCLLIFAVLREFWLLYIGANAELSELGAVGIA